MPDEVEQTRHSSGADPRLAPEYDDEMEARFRDAHAGIMGMIVAALKLRGRELRAAKASLPLTVITGFLGSGKTTLLNHLLVEPRGRRLAVLVNDFGRINIDADLVSSRTEDLISLKNGCACCAVGNDLTQALIDISERGEHPDAIVLEASGVADTRGMVQIALANPSIRLEGVVVVLDAETLRDLAEDPHAGRLFLNQLAAADLIVLSKLDLVEPAQHTAAKEWLAQQFAAIPVVEAVMGNVPTDVVLGVGAPRDARENSAKSDEAHVHDFESLSFTIDEPLDGDRLQTFFDSLPKSLLRAKGVLCLYGDPSRRTIYQRVGSRWTFSPAEPWGGEKPHSSLVFIGPTGSLDTSALKSGLDHCVVSER